MTTPSKPGTGARPGPIRTLLTAALCVLVAAITGVVSAWVCALTSSIWDMHPRITLSTLIVLPPQLVSEDYTLRPKGKTRRLSIDPGIMTLDYNVESQDASYEVCLTRWSCGLPFRTMTFERVSSRGDESSDHLEARRYFDGRLGWRRGLLAPSWMPQAASVMPRHLPLVPTMGLVWHTLVVAPVAMLLAFGVPAIRRGRRRAGPSCPGSA